MYVNSPGGSVTAGNIGIRKLFHRSFVPFEIGFSVIV